MRTGVYYATADDPVAEPWSRRREPWIGRREAAIGAARQEAVSSSGPSAS